MATDPIAIKGPLVSHLTVPSGNTYDIKDSQVWGDRTPTQITDLLNQLLANVTITQDNFNLASAIQVSMLQLSGSRGFEPAWSTDNSFPQTIKNKDMVQAIISIATALEGLKPGGDSIVYRGTVDQGARQGLYPTDGGTESILLNGETDPTSFNSIAPGSLYFYKHEQFIKGEDGTWHSLGSALTTLRALAYKDSASGSYTPGGTVSTPTFTGSTSPVTFTITNDNTSAGNYTPTGTISGGTLSLNTLSSTGAYTPAGSVTVGVETATTTNKTATVSQATSGTTTYKPAGSVSAPTFTGTAGTVTVTGTPAGTVSQPSFSGTAATITAKGTPAGTVTSSFAGTPATITTKGTPAGTVTTPTISVNSAGSTVSVKEVNGLTGKTLMAAAATAAPGGTVSNEIVYYSYANETLSLRKLGYSTDSASLVTTKSTTVKNGDASYNSSQPSFSGALLSSTAVYTPAGTVTSTFSGAVLSATASYTPAGTVSQPSFTGASLTSTGTFTPSGSVSQPTFTGTAVRLVTGNIAVPNTYTASATFSGTPSTVTVSGKPTGSVSALSWTGQKVKISGTVTAAGSVSQPTFSGTPSTITVS